MMEINDYKRMVLDFLLKQPFKIGNTEYKIINYSGCNPTKEYETLIKLICITKENYIKLKGLYKDVGENLFENIFYNYSEYVTEIFLKFTDEKRIYISDYDITNLVTVMLRREKLKILKIKEL